MLLPEIFRWAAVAALAAAAFRLPRPIAFWSLGAGRPFVLARANDARLVAIAAELGKAFDRTNVLASFHRLAEKHPEWSALIDRFAPLEDEMADIAANSLVGALAKARALQIPTCRDCARPEMGNSPADDLVRLGAGALSWMRLSPAGPSWRHRRARRRRPTRCRPCAGQPCRDDEL